MKDETNVDNLGHGVEYSIEKKDGTILSVYMQDNELYAPMELFPPLWLLSHGIPLLKVWDTGKDREDCRYYIPLKKVVEAEPNLKESFDELEKFVRERFQEHYDKQYKDENRDETPDIRVDNGGDLDPSVTNPPLPTKE